MTSTSSEPPRVVILVAEGCHLCDDACAIVGTVCADLDINWLATDLLSEDETTIVKWREFVPVVMIDGDVHDVFRVTADRLRAALSG